VVDHEIELLAGVCAPFCSESSAYLLYCNERQKMSKNVSAFWSSKKQPESSEDFKDYELKLQGEIRAAKHSVLNELKPKIKQNSSDILLIDDDLTMIEKSTNRQLHNICLRLDAIEETLYHMQKKENRD
jgi:hypothetical protein